MKSTRTGAKWAHVSCALWIPEVSIGDVEKMEPITKISCIPVSSLTLLVFKFIIFIVQNYVNEWVENI